MILTTEQFEVLKKYDKHMRTAYYADYIRINDRNVFQDLDKVFNEVFHKSSGILNGCMRCILRDIKALATKYIADVKELELKEQVVETEEVKSMEEKVATKKTTRKTNGKKSNGGK